MRLRGETLRNPNGDSWERERLLEALDTFQRGIGEAPLLRKWNETRQPDTNGVGTALMAFVLSTDEVDRHGDAIAADGWKLNAYIKPPVSGPELPTSSLSSWMPTWTPTSD